MGFVFKLYCNAYAVNGHIPEVLQPGVAKLNWAIPTSLYHCMWAGVSSDCINASLVQISNKNTFKRCILTQVIVLWWCVCGRRGVWVVDWWWCGIAWIQLNLFFCLFCWFVQTIQKSYNDSYSNSFTWRWWKCINYGNCQEKPMLVLKFWCHHFPISLWLSSDWNSEFQTNIKALTIFILRLSCLKYKLFKLMKILWSVDNLHIFGVTHQEDTVFWFRQCYMFNIKNAAHCLVFEW